MFGKLFVSIIILLGLNVKAFANFDFNSNCVKAYKSIIALRLAEGRVLIDREKAQHPQNSITILLDNYYDFFWLLTSENKADFDKLKSNKSVRIDRLEKENEKSPYYNFCIAQVNLQWALVHSRFGEYTAAGLEINRAYHLLQENTKRYPLFLPDNIPLSVVNVLLGSLPNGALKSVLGFFGVRGDTQTGVKMLETLSASLPRSEYAYHYDELIYYLTYIQTDVINDPAAYTKMLRFRANMDTSSLLRDYIASYVALRTGHSTEAINFLEKRHHGSEYQTYSNFDYLHALAKMNRADNDASNYFNKFLQTTRGTSFIKDAYLHLAWSALLDGDNQRYKAFVQLVKRNGYLYNEKDKQALEEANDPPPNTILLRVRLFFDGGYYEKALSILAHKNANDFPLERDKIEYYYRLGRIYDAVDNDNEAIKYYQDAINTGKNSNYHYAASSAIRTGLIYEQRKDNQRARNAYNMVFAFKNRQFKNSLEQKAMDGLKRIGVQ